MYFLLCGTGCNLCWMKNRHGGTWGMSTVEEKGDSFVLSFGEGEGGGGGIQKTAWESD